MKQTRLIIAGGFLGAGKKMQMFGGTPENQISDEDDIM